ncbi:MAG: hypothetical protein AAFO69_03290 [Bacteroidota bacterium]
MSNLLQKPFIKNGIIIITGVLRYFLGCNMMVYGLTKILQTQFIILPFSTWDKPLEQLSGINLTWAFLGYSPWFTVLLGLLEFIPGVLLLFRKTHYLGAILMLPMTLSVTLINYALDLWPGTQRISLILLIINLLILIASFKTVILPVIRQIWGVVSIRRFAVIELLLNFLVIGAVVLYFGNTLLDYKGQTDILTGDWFHKANHVWTITKVSPPQEASDHTLWNVGDNLYFMPYNSMEYDHKKGNKLINYKYQLNDSTNSLRITSNGSNVLHAKYDQQGDYYLILTPIKAKSDSVGITKIRLKKRLISRPQ